MYAYKTCGKYGVGPIINIIIAIMINIIAIMINNIIVVLVFPKANEFFAYRRERV